MADLHHLGFEWKIVKSFKTCSILEITYQNEVYRVSNKKPAIIWSVIRSKLVDMGYSYNDARLCRDIITANG